MALVAPVAAVAGTAGVTARPGAAGVVRTAPPAAAATTPTVSRLVQMQARFQKKQMEEKEQKLLRLYESQQQRAFQRVGRGSAGSTASLSSSTASTLAGSIGGGGGSGGAGKVRQLFEERRSNGWDRSYPLEPVGGGKAAVTATATATTNAPTRHQQLPIAVPKTKQLTRGASLDRSLNHHHHHQQPLVIQQQQKKVPAAAARRSKSHVRAATEVTSTITTNGFYDAEDGHHPFRRNHNSRRQPPPPRHRPPPQDSEDDEDEQGGYAEDEDEEEQDFHRQPPQQRFINNDGDNNNKRQEDLFAKYQVRELSPYDEGTFIYEKDFSHNNGLNQNNNNYNNNDRFKTYVSNKHNNLNNNNHLRGGGLQQQQQQGFKDEIIPRATNMMATKGQDVKKAVPAASRGPAHKKAEQANASGSASGGSSALPHQRTSFGSSAAKKTPPVSKPTSSPFSKNIHNNSGTKASPKAKNGPTAPAAAARSAPTRDDLTECPICHRRFTNDRIKVHQEICAKTSQKKRKEYDATKHRVQGTEAEQFVKKPMRPALVQKKTEPKKADWRKKHEEFIQTIRAAKEAQAHVAAGGKLSDLPPPPPLDTSDYVQCPHCGRKFNEAAADRHIPRCANMQHNKPKPVGKPSGGGFNKRR